MTGDDATSRRLLLRTGAAGLGSLVAGCTNDDDGPDVDREAWADVDEIVLEAYTRGWEGVAPGPIEGETNPTLGLEGGRAYDVTWENGDGGVHNFEFRDDGEVLGATADLSDEGERLTETLEVDGATSQYVCSYHETQMVGDVVVFTE